MAGPEDLAELLRSPPCPALSWPCADASRRRDVSEFLVPSYDVFGDVDEVGERFVDVAVLALPSECAVRVAPDVDDAPDRDDGHVAAGAAEDAADTAGKELEVQLSGRLCR